MAEQDLPQEEREYLLTLSGDLPALRGRVRELRARNWTLRAIGAPLGAPRSTVRAWENHPTFTPSPDSAPPPPSPPNIRPAPHVTHLHVRALTPDVPPDDQARISQLAPLARRVRGGTPPTSPFRQAKQELSTLLLNHYQRGVPVQRLADIAGVSYRAMKVRLDETPVSSATAV